MKYTIIKDENSYNNALKRIEKLFSSKEGTEEFEELLLLTLLIEDYENRTFQFPDVDPVDIINYLVEENNLKQEEITELFNNIETYSNIISRKEYLTLEIIRRLIKRFKISADILITEYKLNL